METTAHKFMVSLGATAGVVATVLQDGVITSTEWSTVIVSLVGTALVWLYPNKPKV